MDRATPCLLEHPASVPATGPESFELVPGAGGRGIGRESVADAADRRAVSAGAVLWLSADDDLAAGAGGGGQSQACPAADASDGAGGDLSQAAAVAAGAGGADLPVFCCGMWRSFVRTRCGARTSRTCRCRGVTCT